MISCFWYMHQISSRLKFVGHLHSNEWVNFVSSATTRVGWHSERASLRDPLRPSDQIVSNARINIGFFGLSNCQCSKVGTRTANIKERKLIVLNLSIPVNIHVNVWKGETEQWCLVWKRKQKQSYSVRNLTFSLESVFRIYTLVEGL